jgi:hypothetical protein
MIKPVPHYQQPFYTKQTPDAIRITPQLQTGGALPFFLELGRRRPEKEMV